MHAHVVGQFRMEGGHEVPPLLDQHRVARVLRQHLDPGTGAADNRRADKHRLQFAWGRAHLKFRRRIQFHHPAVQLPAVGVSLHGDIHQPEAFLRGVGDVPGHQDGAGASSEHGLAPAKLGQIVEQVFGAQEFEHSGTLTAGQDQAGDLIQLRALPDIHGRGAGAAQCRAVRRKIALQREHSHLLHGYQPRVCNNSPSGILEISRPGMAAPRLRLASSSFWGLLKFLAAITMALARLAGSLDLKIPDPTNTASAPNCITRAASAGVAMPPAEKFGTGSVPCRATHSTSSRGACRFLAAAASSSAPSTVSCFISRTMVRMWRTASTMLPLPASPLVRIMAAPSPIRRSASPKLRAPQTNGTLKSFLSMWCSSSAGVSTSLSSMKSTPSASRMRASMKWPMRALAITGMVTVFMISSMMPMFAMRATPPSRRMSEGTRSRAITADAPASSAILACSALVTSIMTPPFNISARPTFTRNFALENCNIPHLANSFSFQ